MNMLRTLRRCRGFTLIEAAIVAGIVALLAALLVPVLVTLLDTDRSVKASADLSNVYTAIVGTPNSGNFGYLGDVGQYPASLMDLIRSPGLAGWNGPYLLDVNDNGTAIYDSFGSALEYFYVADPGAVTDLLAVISKGTNQMSTNTSVTPNVWSTYAGAPLPSSSAYYSATGNADNIAVPPFTDNAGLLSYNNVGQLNLNVFNWDYNANVSGFVPACPNMFDIKVTSATRPADTWGSASAGTTPTYNPGGASFDLIQGIYKVQLRLATTPYPVYWDETLSLSPGASQNRTIQLPTGPDSSATAQYVLNITNSLTSSVKVYTFNTLLATVAGSGGVSGDLLVRGCAPVTVRDSTSNQVLDAFTMPVGINRVSRIYSTDNYTYTLTNNTGTYRYLFVYLNNLLLGEVSGWGNKKVKVFSNLKAGDQIIIKDQTGSAPLSPITISGSGSNTL